MPAIIATEKLTKSYGSHRGIVDVDLEIAQGEVFGFLGPNGAGKTTTIRVLLDHIRPTAGRATVFGIETTRDPVAIHRRTGYLPGEFTLYDRLTGGQTLEYFGNLRGGVDRAYQAALVERLDLDPSRRFKEYSKGNKQKVGLVIALQHRPELLILDEPTAGLDPLVQQTFFEILRECVQAGSTVFLSSHILSEVEKSCDRVAIIREGRLVKTATVAALVGDHTRAINLVLARPAENGAFDLPGVTVLSSTGQDVHLMVRGDVNSLLHRLAGLEVRDIAISTPDVEDLFFRYYDGSVAGSEGRTAAAAGTETSVEMPR